MNNQDRERAQLESAQAECARLREENARLRRLLSECGMPVPAPEQEKIPIPTPEVPDARPAVNNESDPEVKIALFRSLFRGREDVYAIRKKFKDGTWGYVPHSIRNWKAVLSSTETERKKVDRETRKLLPLKALRKTCCPCSSVISSIVRLLYSFSPLLQIPKMDTQNSSDNHLLFDYPLPTPPRQ